MGKTTEVAEKKRGERGRAWNSIRSKHPKSALSPTCCYFLLEREPASNVVLNIQSGANHLGPEDFRLMLEEVE